MKMMRANHFHVATSTIGGCTYINLLQQLVHDAVGSGASEIHGYLLGPGQQLRRRTRHSCDHALE